MMRDQPLLRGFALVFLLAAGAATSRADTLKIDSVHSGIQFEIRHLFSKVPGRFNKFEGTVEMNKEAPEQSTVSATIQTASVDTGNEKRDGHLRSADFFDVEKFPTITFQSTKITKTSETTGTIEGDFTMHGVTKPVTLNVEYLGMGPGMKGGKVAGFSAKTTLNRTEFGLKWNNLIEGTSVLGDEVAITINVEASEQ